MREITPETLAAITPTEIEAVEDAWLQRSKSPEYLAARDAMGAVLGEAWFLDPAEPFTSITERGEAIGLPYGVISAARWAHAATQVRNEITAEQFEVLTAAWSVLR